MIGQTISHYRVIEKLGSGGMGVVYKAEDMRLHRFVAIKFLPKEVADDLEAVDRFQREAHAASALNHPNICTIHDVGEQDGHPFIVMEYIEGVTLAYKIAGRPLGLDCVLRFAIEIAEVLDAAHTAGIIHRDIKTANVLINKRDQAKVLDFGLAKVSARGPGPGAGPDDPTFVDRHLTTAGSTLGTVAYMSPEQIEGKPLDGRSDIFSFGVVLYEMATGRLPFDKPTQGATFGAILHEQPLPVKQLNPNIPGRLEEIILKALEKNRDLRYLHTSEMRADLQRLKRDLESGRVSSADHTLSWSALPTSAAVPEGSATAPSATVRTHTLPWKTLLGLVVLAAIAGSVTIWRVRSRPKLTDKDTIVLADFNNTSGDPVFDDTLKQAISVQLGQSPFLNILSESRTRATLKLMAKPPGTKVTADVARDLCQRAGAKAYVAGAIGNLGSQYVIGLDAVNCETGDSLGEEQVTAENKEQVLRALGEAATKLRAKLGESLSTVEKFDIPLDQATTPSLDALKALSVGRATLQEQGSAAAIPFFNRAIEFDPNFAAAYAALGISYSNLREPGRASENLRKAYDLRDRVSERERFRISATYYLLVTGELEKAIQTYEMWAKTYPRSSEPFGNLGVDYTYLGEYEKGVDASLEDLRLNPGSAAAFTNLVGLYTALDRLSDAKATYEQAIAHKVSNPFLHGNRYGVAFLEGDASEMQRQVAEASAKPGEDVLLSFESDTEAFQGRLARARDLSNRAAASALGNESPETAAAWRMDMALRDAEFRNIALSRKEIASALATATTRDVSILAALAFARIGENDRAKRLADDLAGKFPFNTVINRYWLPTIYASIELQRGNPAKAVELLQTTAQYELGSPLPQFEVGGSLYPVYIRGQAYLLLHQGAEAVGEFHKFLDQRGVAVNCPLAALARLHLARAYVLTGDSQRASDSYEEFFALFKDADPDIAILKEAKAEYAKLQ
ncbi:MAG: protein kinase [Candidatus Sulfotelmatobacter sp.]